MKSLVNKKSKTRVNQTPPEVFDFFSQHSKRGHEMRKRNDPEGYREQQRHAAIKGWKTRRTK